ncbi:MAG: DUF1674 domain-containing protein [Henriciella sp.]|jgi:hypothetical protein
MSDDKNITKDDLPPAAKRALEEAAERRAAQEAKEAELEALRSNESGGPKEERVRYGDWEKAGRAVDF